MSSSTHEQLSTPIRRLILASIAVAATALFYVEFASKSHATTEQHHLQVGQVRTSVSDESLLAQKPVTQATVTIEF